MKKCRCNKGLRDVDVVSISRVLSDAVYTFKVSTIDSIWTQIKSEYISKGLWNLDNATKAELAKAEEDNKIKISQILTYVGGTNCRYSYESTPSNCISMLLDRVFGSDLNRVPASVVESERILLANILEKAFKLEPKAFDACENHSYNNFLEKPICKIEKATGVPPTGQLVVAGAFVVGGVGLAIYKHRKKKRRVGVSDGLLSKHRSRKSKTKRSRR